MVLIQAMDSAGFNDTQNAACMPEYKRVPKCVNRKKEKKNDSTGYVFKSWI